MSFIVIALDGGLLERSVHPFDLAVGPWMVGLGETMLDLVLAADTIEHVHPVAGSRASARSSPTRWCCAQRAPTRRPTLSCSQRCATRRCARSHDQLRRHTQ